MDIANVEEGITTPAGRMAETRAREAPVLWESNYDEG